MATLEGRRFQCALGKEGVAPKRGEGDNITPVGTFVLRMVFFRPDRITVTTGLLAQAMTESDGWCDYPSDAAYNTHVTLPHPDSHEKLWREDNIYDVVVPVGYNDDPVVPGAGSAIFMHLAREGYTPTAGCIAFAREDMLTILGVITGPAQVTIHQEPLAAEK